tara:strand:+ start:97656 stop:98141 length:486 start_codon:yes stop_codon:yes gene_type:complete
MKYLKEILVASSLSLMTLGGVIAQEQKVAVQPQQNNSQETELSDAELKKFVKIYKSVQNQNKQAQQQMAKTIQEEGITIKRYQKLAQATKKPKSDVVATAEEKEKMKAINEEFKGIQKEFKSKITDVITDGGMTTKRYQQVYQMIRTDKELQAEFGELMQG